MSGEQERAPLLHVACLVYPSFQGTQAAIGAMLDAAASSSGPAELLTYAHGAYEAETSFVHHRVPDFPKNRSLRSGPSMRKILLDLRCVVELRRLVSVLQPAAIVAHHVEAAAAALAAHVRPVYYLAHTSLRDELPQYFPAVRASPISAFAGFCEQRLCASVDGVAAVAPSLAQRLGPKTTYLPVPWKPTAQRPDDGQRLAARRACGLSETAPVCLYAGNLDRYQGFEHLLAALAELRKTRRDARLLLATESPPHSAQALLRRHGVQDAVLIRRLAGEAARHQVHAAADLAWIPRRTPGGLPIKMLDAFARGLPVVAMERATAGLNVGGACIRVTDDDPVALARGAERVLNDTQRSKRLTQRAERYLTEHHSAAGFSAALDRWTGRTEPGARLRNAPAPAPRDVPAQTAR